MENIEDLKKQAQEALDADDTEKAKELIAQIKDIQAKAAERDALSAELDGLTKSDVSEDDSKEVSEDKAEEEPVKEESDESDEPDKKEKEERSDETEEVEVEEKEEKPAEEVADEKGEKRSMGEFEPIVENDNTEVRAIAAYLKSKGAERRDGLTTVGAEAVIPVEEITKPQEQPEKVIDLRNLVNRVSVNTGSGSYPVLKKTKATLHTVAELEKNPELAKPEFIKVPWAVETYRGYIGVSKEALDDSDQNLAGMVAKNIERQTLNTSNAAIATVLKTAAKKTIDGIDGLKDLVNVAIDPAYNVSFVVSQSFFNEIDKVKDADGRYMLQQDVTAPSGYSLLGRRIEVLADDVIGAKAGDQVAFVGDAEAFVTYFDRAQASVKWTDNDIYGELLASALRFDVKATDTEAGHYVTLKLAETPAP